MRTIRELADESTGAYIDDSFFKREGEIILDGRFTLQDLIDIVEELKTR